MANKQRGYVEVQLDRPRKLRYDTNALAELEDLLGFPVTQLNENTVGVKVLRGLLWAGLLHESPDLTVKEAGELMNHGDLSEIADKIFEALDLAFGSNADTQKNKASGPNGVGRK